MEKSQQQWTDQISWNPNGKELLLGSDRDRYIDKNTKLDNSTP